MKRIVSFVCVIMFVAVSFYSCKTSESVYIRDAELDSAQTILNTYNETIHTGDALYIYVYSQIPESAVPFNQEFRTLMTEQTHTNKVGYNHSLTVNETYDKHGVTDVVGYVVKEDGFITFPILGKMSVAGITRDSLAHYIEKRLEEGDLLKDPVVSVSLMNFRVSVIGEVRSPKELHVSSERLTLFEALAMCGDVTIYGQRDNIVVMRVKDGKTIPIEVDMTRKTVFDSEVYYLQNNDIVYVQPTRSRQRELNFNYDIPEYVSMSASVIHIVRGLIKSYTRINRVTP